MEILLFPALIIGVWLVLRHIRRQQFLKEYLDLQNKALEKGVELPKDLKELMAGKTNWAGVMLRVGIISLVLGITGVLIGVFFLPNTPGIPAKDSDTVAIFASFWAFGLLLAAFGIGNLICWLLIDKRRGGGDK